MNNEKWSKLSNEEKLIVLGHIMTIKKIILCEEESKKNPVQGLCKPWMGEAD